MEPEPNTHENEVTPLIDENQNSTSTTVSHDPNSSHGENTTVEGEEFTNEEVINEEGQNLNKRLIEDVLLNTSGPYEVDDGPDKKKRKMSENQQLKRHKYDIVQAFFRVYFVCEKDAMVLKDLIYNLYCKKVQSDYRIARNALYRHMWSYHKDKVSAFQSNYREYVKGIKLRNQQNVLESDNKDIELLRASGPSTSTDLWDFSETEISGTPTIPDIKLTEIKPASPPQISSANNPVNKYGVAPSYLDNDNLLTYIESLEQTAKQLANAIKELKSRVRKK